MFSKNVKPNITSQSQKSKHPKKHLYQNNIISNDITILTEKESNGTLTEPEIKKFRLLLAREPIIKIQTKGI